MCLKSLACELSGFAHNMNKIFLAIAASLCVLPTWSHEVKPISLVCEGTAKQLMPENPEIDGDIRMYSASFLIWPEKKKVLMYFMPAYASFYEMKQVWITPMEIKFAYQPYEKQLDIYRINRATLAWAGTLNQFDDDDNSKNVSREMIDGLCRPVRSPAWNNKI